MGVKRVEYEEEKKYREKDLKNRKDSKMTLKEEAAYIGETLWEGGGTLP